MQVTVQPVEAVRLLLVGHRREPLTTALLSRHVGPPSSVTGAPPRDTASGRLFPCASWLTLPHDAAFDSLGGPCTTRRKSDWSTPQGARQPDRAARRSTRAKPPPVRSAS